MQKILLALFCCLLQQSASAITYLYFQNNTSLPFQVSAAQSGGSLAANRWGSSITSLTAWQKETQLLWTNRSTGITNGVDFYFDVHLINNGDTVTLRLKLQGTLTHSNLWQSAAGPSFSHAWFGDRTFHTATFSMGGRNFTLKYSAQATAGDDDVYYALQENDAWPTNAAELADSNVLNLLAYNIYMLTPPIAYTDQNERAAEIPNHVHDYDAILFSEAFHNSAREDDLLPALSLEYPYYTPVVNSNTPEDGGVFIASRWPIDTFASIVYNNCDGDDCLAAKGVMYVRINKLGKRFHLFATHTQAWNDTINVNTRVLQLAQLRLFMATLDIPAHEAVLVGGDLNVDKIVNNQNEYFRMLDSLDAMEPTYLGHGLTYDADLSYYADTDHEYLDYILPIGNYLLPDTAHNEPIILRSIADDMWGYYDLSDHFAVRGRFVYAPLEQPVAVQQAAAASPSPYPNPAKDKVYLSCLSACKLELVDALGRRVAQWEIPHPQTAEIDIASLPSGAYFLHQQQASTNTVFKLIKE